MCGRFHKMMMIFQYAGVDLNGFFLSELMAYPIIVVKNMSGKIDFGSILFEMNKTCIVAWTIYITTLLNMATLACHPTGNTARFCSILSVVIMTSTGEVMEGNRALKSCWNEEVVRGYIVSCVSQ